jgi:hypothetical protein
MAMRLPYLKNARVKLQERKNACIRTTYEHAESHFRFFIEFLRTDPVIRAITTELSVICKEKFSDVKSLVDEQHRRLNLPQSEIDCAAFRLRACEVIASPTEHFPLFERVFGKGTHHYQDMHNQFCEQVLLPLYAYIDERIDTEDELLYSLSRYQRECSWFEADALVKLAAEADSAKLEAVLDSHLRAWLFREGIDYPFSTPHSPSGRADVVVWHGEKPLPIEVKVFDGVNRDTGHVSQGLWQAHRYAVDYGNPFGYFVVFNTSEHLLAFEGNVQTEGPPCIVVAGMNVVAIVVGVGKRDTASKEKPRETKIVKTPGSADG